MNIFSTKIPVDKSLSHKEFIKVTCDWLNSRGRACIPEEICPIETGYNEKSFGENQKYRVFSLYHKEKKVVALRIAVSVLENLVWFYDFILSEDVNCNFLTVHTSCKKDSTVKIKESSGRPLLLDYIIQKGYCLNELGLSVSGVPSIADEGNIDLLSKVYKKELKLNLPLVYVTRTKEENKLLVNIEKLGKDLRGVAYVVAEINSGVSEKLYDLFGRKVPVDGKVGVINIDGKTSVYVGKGTVRDEVFSRKVTNLVCDRMRSIYSNDTYSWEGISCLVALSRKVDGDKKHIELEDLYNSVLDMKNDELRQSELVIDSLKEEIKQLKGKVQFYEDAFAKKVSSEVAVGDVSLFCGEKEFYEGEVKDCILKILEKERNQMSSDPNMVLFRKYHILTSILKGNELTDRGEEFAREIKKVFSSRSGKHIRDSRELKKLGFSINGQCHDRLIFNNDDRYLFTLSRTPSDSRSAENAASVVLNTLVC